MILERIQYGFDRDSRRTWRRQSLATGEDYRYGYDGLNQVVSSDRGNLNMNCSAIAAVPVQAESWDYDPTGNWHGYKVEADGAVTLDQDRVHDKGNRLMQIEGDTHAIETDRVGRMTRVNGLLVKWDAWCRVKEVRSDQEGSPVTRYFYDGLSRRIMKDVDLAYVDTYYSDSWRPLEERNTGMSGPNTQYFWGARHRDDLVRRDSNLTGGATEVRYVLMDYYNPAAITNEIGVVTERYSFSAFGERRILAPDFNPRGTSECGWEFSFQGQFQDWETGFLNYGYRYYAPNLGRWLCKDPIKELGSPNMYAFVGNQPTNHTDFLGLADELGPNKQSRCTSTVVGDHGLPPGASNLPPGNKGDSALKKFLDSLEQRSSKGDRCAAVGCFNGDINKSLKNPIPGGKEKFNDTKQPIYGRPRPDYNDDIYDNDPNVVNPEQPGFMWPDEALDYLQSKIQAAETQAEADCENKDNCCKTVTIVVICRPSGANGIDFAKFAGGSGRGRALCNHNATLDCRTGTWNPSKFKA